MPPLLVTTTFTELSEAEELARILLGKRLIACGQITTNVTSIYWWKDEITKDQECVLAMKTTEDLYDEVEKTICAHHSYDTPEIIALPLTYGSSDYFNWLEKEVQHG